jgi:hypothetical protein
MAETTMPAHPWNPWKVATVGMVVVFATALITGIVVARYAGSSRPESADTAAPPDAAQPGTAAQPESAPPQPGAAAQPAPPPPPRANVAEAPRPAPHRVAARPTVEDVEACNHYANSVGRDKTTETFKDGLLGGALGAGLGAAGGAIAGGGGGAGKGAGIGGLVGAAAGTLYGLNDANKSPSASAAYRACMKRRGYVN